MRRTVLQGKIHGATVTGASEDYEGSISLDASLMEAAGIIPFEQVHVLGIDGGARVVTYVIPADAGSGAVVMNGPAAKLIGKGERVIVLSYGQLKAEKAGRFSPRIVRVDGANRVLEAGPPADEGPVAGRPPSSEPERLEPEEAGGEAADPSVPAGAGEPQAGGA